MAFWTASDTGLSASYSVDLANLVSGGNGKFLLMYWVAPATLEGGSGYSIDSTCEDPLGYSTARTGGVGDGSVPVSLCDVFEFQYNGTGPWTFDIGYFSPGGLLRLDYTVTAWTQFP